MRPPLFRPVLPTSSARTRFYWQNASSVMLPWHLWRPSARHVHPWGAPTLKYALILSIEVSGRGSTIKSLLWLRMTETAGGGGVGDVEGLPHGGGGIRRGDWVAGEGFKVRRRRRGGGVGGGSRLYKWKHERPLYLELLKIARQMVAEASGRPDTRLPFQAGGINRRGVAHKAPWSLLPTVAVG